MAKMAKIVQAAKVAKAEMVAKRSETVQAPDGTTPGPGTAAATRSAATRSAATRSAATRSAATRSAATPRDLRRVRLGSGGERLAATWLEARGLRVLARNWRCPYGELDLVAEDGAEVVFVEVKTRRGDRMGAPEEAITPAKRRHLLAASMAYLAEHGRDDAPYRIDVVAVQLAPSGALLEIRYYERAIALDD